MPIYLFRTVLFVFSLFFCFATAEAQSGLSSEQKDEIRLLVREYILQNPEIIIEALNLFEARQAAAQTAARQEAINTLQEKLYHSKNQAVLGNLDGDITLVEFFDYNCGFCKRAHEDMVALLEENPNLRFVLKEFPVLGPGSLEAARVSIAVYQLAPDAFEDFHMQLLLSPGQANEAKALGVAKSLGLDMAGLEKLMEKEQIAMAIQESYELADAIGIDGTPSYVVGNEAIFGAVGAGQLEQAIARVRGSSGSE